MIPLKKQLEELELEDFRDEHSSKKQKHKAL